MDTEGVPILGLLRSLEPRYPTALVSQIRDKHNRPTDTAGPAESSQNLSGSVNTTTTSSTTVVVGSSTNPTENSSPHSPTPTPNKPHLRVMRIHESKGVSRHTDCPYGTTGNSPIVGATNPTVPPTRSRPKWLYHNPEKNSREVAPQSNHPPLPMAARTTATHPHQRPALSGRPSRRDYSCDTTATQSPVVPAGHTQPTSPPTRYSE